MKNILMMHYDLHFYRIPIYNLLAEQLKKENINLIIWPEKILNYTGEFRFECIEKDINYHSYKNTLKDYKIDCVINFLQPRSPSFSFYLKMIFYTYLKNIPLIYYGHGLNLSSDNKTINLMYNFLHLFYKSIILYTPNEINKLWKIHHKKVEIAYNTLYLTDRINLINKSKKELRKKYNLDDEFVILFSGRIEKRKKLDVLIEFINEQNNPKIKLLVVGPTKDKDILSQLNNNEKIIYLGPIYDIVKMSEIFFISDVFSIPGHIGLGLVEALYWGLPILTLDVKHAPEIYYLENNFNGFLLKNEIELKDKFHELSFNKELLDKLSQQAKLTYKNKADLTNMLNGFIISIKKVVNNDYTKINNK